VVASTHSTKWFWSDWRGDEAVRRLTPSERGVWIDLLALAATGNPTGYVCDANGDPVAIGEIARFTNCPDLDELRKLIVGIEAKGAVSRDRAGRLFNRRMVRDAALSLKRRHAAEIRYKIRKKQHNPILHMQNGKKDKDPSSCFAVLSSSPLSESGKVVEKLVAARADSAPLVSGQAMEMAVRLHAAVGWDRDNPRAIGSAYTAQKWLNGGWDGDLCVATVTRVAATAGARVRSLAYFEPAIAEAHANLTAPVPVVVVVDQSPRVIHAASQSQPAAARTTSPGGFARNVAALSRHRSGDGSG
jgi:hypothetical protein